jgi:hypothetical protein
MLAASTAATTGGAMMNANAQNQAIEGQNQANRDAMQMNAQARADEQVRQRQFEDQQAASVAEALAGADPAKALLAAQQEVAAPTNEIVQSADAYNGEPAGGPTFKNRAVDAAAQPDIDKRNARTDDMAEALAMLTSIGTQFDTASRGIGRSGSNIATIGSNRRGSMGVAGQEANIPAAEVTANPGLIGDILLLGGQAGSSLAGGRMGKAGVSIGDVLLPKKKLPKVPAGLGTGALY